MSWNQVFQQFVKDSPVTVMMRGILEHALPPARSMNCFASIPGVSMKTSCCSRQWSTC